MAIVLAMVGAGCNDDGRTLRPAKPSQNQTISTTVAPTDPVIGEEGAFGSLPVFVPGTDVGVDDTTVSAFTVTAPWRDAGAIDARYTCDGANVSPALSWTAAPVGTVEIAITLTDDDAPGFVHWVIGGIDPSNIALGEATVPEGAYQATNGDGEIGYSGPCPPTGSEHGYRVTVHYLGQQIELGDGADGHDLLLAVDSASIAFAEVTGTYSRP